MAVLRLMSESRAESIRKAWECAALKESPYAVTNKYGKPV